MKVIFYKRKHNRGMRFTGDWVEEQDSLVIFYKRKHNTGFTDMTVNHTYFFKDLDTSVHTNTIEGLWVFVKQDSREHNIRNLSDHWDSYFLEFARKRKNDSPFDYSFKKILKTVVQIYLPSTKDVPVHPLLMAPMDTTEMYIFKSHL